MREPRRGRRCGAALVATAKAGVMSPASDIDNTDFYYEDRVIGGLGAFAVSIKDRKKFKESAGRTPGASVGPCRRKRASGARLIGENSGRRGEAGKSANP